MVEHKYVATDADASTTPSSPLPTQQAQPTDCSLSPLPPFAGPSFRGSEMMLEVSWDRLAPNAQYRWDGTAITSVWMELVQKIITLLRSREVVSLQADDRHIRICVFLLGSDETTVVDKCHELLHSYNLGNVRVNIKPVITTIPAYGVSVGK